MIKTFTSKNRLILIFLVTILLVAKSGTSQSISSLNSQLNDVVRILPDNIYNEDKCSGMINELQDISHDIAKLLKEEDIDNERELSLMKQQATALENFIRTVGVNNSASGQLTADQLNLVKKLIQLSIVEVYKGTFCAIIYELKIESYKCLLLFKTGRKNDIWRIKARLRSASGNATTSIDSGLESNHFRRIWSGGQNRNPAPQKVLSVECILNGNFSF